MKDWIKAVWVSVWLWGVLVVASAVIFAASFGTSWHQFGVGLLCAAVALLVIMLVFEAIWQGVVHWLDTVATRQKTAPEREVFRQHRPAKGT